MKKENMELVSFKDWADSWGERTDEEYREKDAEERKWARTNLRVRLCDRLKLIVGYWFGDKRLEFYREKNILEMTETEVEGAINEYLENTKRLERQLDNLDNMEELHTENKKKLKEIEEELKDIQAYPFGKVDMFHHLSNMEIELFELLLTSIDDKKGTFIKAKLDKWNEIEKIERIVELLEVLSETEKWGGILKEIDWIKFRLLYPTAYKCCYIIEKACKYSEANIRGDIDSDLKNAYIDIAYDVGRAYSKCVKSEKKKEKDCKDDTDEIADMVFNVANRLINENNPNSK